MELDQATSTAVSRPAEVPASVQLPAEQQGKGGALVLHALQGCMQVALSDMPLPTQQYPSPAEGEGHGQDGAAEDAQCQGDSGGQASLEVAFGGPALPFNPHSERIIPLQPGLHPGFQGRFYSFEAVEVISNGKVETLDPQSRN